MSQLALSTGLHVGDCVEGMRTLPDGCANLCVTSPPYNADMDYGEGIDDARSWDEYWEWAKCWLGEVQRVLCDGGRLALNVPGIMGRSPAIPVAAQYTILLLDLGYLFRGEIVWYKNASRNNSTAWGSWCSPSNPCLRDTHEKILVASKGDWRLPNPRGETPDITAEAFTRDTLSVWAMSCERQREHPCPFPEEMAERLLPLLSWPGDLILDPFLGSGTTAVVCERLGRNWVGFELSTVYAALIAERLRRQRAQYCLELT